MKTKDNFHDLKEEVKIENIEKVSGGVRYYVTLWRCPNCGATRERSERMDQESFFNFYSCLHCGTPMTEKVDSWIENRP